MSTTTTKPRRPHIIQDSGWNTATPLELACEIALPTGYDPKAEARALFDALPEEVRADATKAADGWGVERRVALNPEWGATLYKWHARRGLGTLSKQEAFDRARSLSLHEYKETGRKNA